MKEIAKSKTLQHSNMAPHQQNISGIFLNLTQFEPELSPLALSS